MMIGISLLLAFKQCLKNNVYTCTYSKYDVCMFEALKLVFIILSFRCRRSLTESLRCNLNQSCLLNLFHFKGEPQDIQLKVSFNKYYVLIF